MGNARAATGCWAPQADSKHKTKGPHASPGVLCETTTDSLHWLTDALVGSAGQRRDLFIEVTVSQSQRRSAPPAWLRRILCGGGETRVPQGVSRSARACCVYTYICPPERTMTDRHTHGVPCPTTELHGALPSSCKSNGFRLAAFILRGPEPGGQPLLLPLPWSAVLGTHRIWRPLA